MSQPPEHLLAGRYRTVRRLGSGGMAVVLLAEDERLGRRVAIKRMHAESADEVAKRFRREAQLGAALNHPSIVAIFDIETDEDDVLIVMEYVPGGTLKDALARGPVERGAALVLLRDVAAALDYAHQHGIVHRDVKPANVLIGGDGRAKLADLGIATAAEVTSITRTGSLLGTAAYMAPERLGGEAGDAAVDVYALAAVAFETLSGHRARSGRSPVEIARQVTATPPPDIREYLPDLSPRAADVLQRGMARDPAERPASAGALIAELERALGAADTDAAAAAGEEGTAATAPLDGEVPDLRAVRAARVLAGPPPRTASAAAAATPPSGGRGARPPRKRPEPAPRRRGGLNRAIAAPGMLGLLVIVAVGIGLAQSGGDKKSNSGSGGQQTGSGGGSSGTQTQTQTQPPAAELTPQATVKQFYERAAADDFGGAWNLLGPSAREQLGGRASFQATLQSLEKIEFTDVRVLSKSPIAAVVAIQTIATHPDKLDRCSGNVQLTNDSSGWRIQRLNIGCESQPRGGATPPQTTPGKGPAGGRPIVPKPKKDKPKKQK